MIEKQKISEWIDRYNDNDLPAYEHLQFVEMISRHPVLRAEVRLDKELNTIIENEDILDLLHKLEKVRKSTKKSGSGFSFFLLAASFLALIATAILVFLFLPDPYKSFYYKVSAERPVAGHPSASGKLSRYLNLSKTSKCLMPVTRYENDINRQLIASYQPLPELELLIGASARADDLHILSPQPRISLPDGSTVLFEWNPVHEEVNLTLEIIDNTGSVLSTRHLPNSGRFILDTVFLGKGLIYWKLIMDEEIIYLGSIILM